MRFSSGAAKTIQRKGDAGGDSGANFKIIPISSKCASFSDLSYQGNVFLAEEVLNKITCFQSNGSQADLVDVQHTIPDKNSFEVLNQSIGSMKTIVISLTFQRI